MAIVLAVVTVSAMPRFRARWQRVQEERAAFSLAQSLRTARSLAAAHSRSTAWVWDAQARRMWIGQAQDDGSTEPVAGRLGAPQALPQDVAVQALQAGQPVERIVFLPDGTAQAATVMIGADPEHPHYAVAVEAATGQVTVTSSLLPTAS